MKIFSRLYARVLHLVGHRHASWYLAGLSFAESSFFPVPPDVMLIPMALGQRRRAWYFAMIATLGSVVGGLLGYTIGLLAFETVEPWIQQWGYGDAYLQARTWFEHWGVWAVFLAGFTPIPYKIFTISAGVVSMAFIPFVLASLVGRGARFFLVAGVIFVGGERMERLLHRYIDLIGWVVLAVLLIAYVIYTANH
jgi:membrane protein YqaA with SNARE-associated domain